MRDLDIIHRELLLKDIQQFKNAADGMKKNVERGVGGKEKKFEYVSQSYIVLCSHVCNER